MTRFAIPITLASLLAIGGYQATAAQEKPPSPEALKAEIEALKPAELAWREIRWRTCLLEGLKEARQKKKPILLWVVGPGDALDGRC